jgi:prepilin-type N-terminal cleavage/methylation domain-containing protein
LVDRGTPPGPDVGADAGFTLVEIMVVLLILTILLAVVIPTFLGVTVSATHPANQFELSTAMIATDSSSRTPDHSQAKVSTSEVQAAEPGLNFTKSASTTPSQSSEAASTDGRKKGLNE